MTPNDFLLTSYGIYLGISVLLTVWVARTLLKSGRVFLVDAFAGNETLADSVNHLLGVGFYLVNLGYVAMKLRASSAGLESYAQVLEQVSGKVGYVMLTLGVMHFLNLWVFSRMRKRGLARLAPPPVLPNEFLTPRTPARVA